MNIDHKFKVNQFEKRIARLAWNDNGWIKPSGRNGKSNNKDSHEGKYGYGHEEWLFDTSKIIDGFHYGFLEPIRKQQQAYVGNIYNVWLYTIDGSSKKRYWIGEINNVEVIENETAEIIKEVYVKKGWHQEMKNQIVDSGANGKGFSEWKGVDLFNVRFKISDIHFRSDYFELPRESKIYRYPRYTFAKYETSFTPLFSESKFIFKPRSMDSCLSKSDLNSVSDIGNSFYLREPKAVEIKYVHKMICKELLSNLSYKYGYENVNYEVAAGYGANKIDIVVRDEEKYIFYEVKSYNSSRTAIREALGQLLEYSCWITNSNAIKLVIVSQKLGDSEEAIKYVRHLRNLYELPIYFQTYDFESKEFSIEY